MFDWIIASGATNFALDSAGSATILSIVAFLTLFAAGLAERAYRMQSLGVFAGLATAMLLATTFVLATIGHALLGLVWVQKSVSGELFFYVFCLGFSGTWLGAALSSSRLNQPPQARRVFLRWQIVLLSILAAVFACGAGEGYGLFHLALNAALRQIFVGIVAGIFVIATGVAIYRLWRERVALWLWLALASLVFAGALSLFHFLPPAPLLAYAALGLAAFSVIIGLFADHVRFLRLESELRGGFMENALKLEAENRRHAAILKLNREAVVHFDRDERIVYANPNFLQLVSAVTAPVQPDPSGKAQSGKTAAPITSSAKTNETNSPVSQLTDKKLSAPLPRELYQKLIPSMQEARLGRTSLMEIRHLAAGGEKLFQVFAAPLRDSNDKIYSTHLSLLDVTARHLSARSLESAAAEKAKELQIFQQSVESANDAVVVTDTDNKILYANEAFERITGFARSEIVGRTPQAYHLDGEAGRLAEINRRLLQHKSWRGEVPGRRKDGSRFIGDLSVSLVADEEEKIFRYLWVERDVTSYKELEARSQQLEEKLAQKTAEIARAKQSEASLQEHTGELQKRVNQLAKLMEIGEDIRLNVGLDMIMTRISEAVAALGWQRVLIFQHQEQETFSLVANSGFANRAAALRQVRQLPYAEFASYLLERFQLSQSFFIDSRQLTGTKRLAFMPANLEAVPNGDWQGNDALLVPIRSRDQIIGLIVVASPADGRRPDMQRVRDLELLADDAAIAIENTRLLAFHKGKERQARVLADLGQVFRVAGAVEQVMIDIAGIGAGAFACPCLVVLVPARERGWLGALGETAAKSGRSSSRLLEEAELSTTRLAQLADAVATMDIARVGLNNDDATPPFVKDIAKAKSTDSATKLGTAQVVALRSRGRTHGFMAYLTPADHSAAAFAQAHDLAFAADIADRAALAIENARLFHEIDEKAIALERANQFISEFLASVSHELRTPMHSILQFSEILLSEIPGVLNPEQKRQLEVVQRSGKNLLVLLNDILDLSKVEAGKMEAIIEEFEPAQVIREAADSIRPLCEKKSLALRVRLDENLPEQFRSDRTILSRVLTNLLGNAVKFTEKGEIEINARKRDRTLVFSVRDTGIGIPPSRQKEIFERFRQLENSETRRHSGTGLGLAISKKMLAIIHGKIEIDSEAGKGSKFTVHIPESTLPVRAARREQKGKKETAKEVPAKKEKSGLRFALVNRAKTPRILVVEDDESTRYAMQFILENAGYKVDFAEGGEKALLAAQHQRPDLILMDIMMPNMDGYQVARMLKAQKQLAHIPVIALTARAMKGDREKALDAGCNDYLTKPFESKDILGMLEKWLGNGT